MALWFLPAIQPRLPSGTLRAPVGVAGGQHPVNGAHEGSSDAVTPTSQLWGPGHSCTRPGHWLSWGLSPCGRVQGFRAVQGPLLQFLRF